MSKDGHNNSENESEIEKRVVTVGSVKGHRALTVVMLVLLFGGVYYFYFGSSEQENVEIITKEIVKQDVGELKENLEKPPEAIDIPDRIITTPLPPLPPLPTPQTIPEVKQVKKEEEVKKREEENVKPPSILPILPGKSHSINISPPPNILPSIGGGGYPRERRAAQMLAISGGGEGGGRSAIPVLSDTAAKSSQATRVGKLGLMIVQGKVIDAILETAIRSDLQGVLRAVVSRDVYAETGDTVLIPKGSRLIGGYSFDSNVAKARVSINWNRLILPHGIDIAIASPGTDELGRAGIGGVVDNKITSALFSSILLAGISVGSAVAGQKASNFVDALTATDIARSITATEIDISPLKDVIGEAGNNAGSDKWKLGLRAIQNIRDAKSDQDLLDRVRKKIAETLEIDENEVKISLDDIKPLLNQVQRRSKSVYETAIEQSINNFSKDMRDVVDRLVDKKPTIYVDQGTALKVFVNQDIVFPPQAILNR